MAGDEKVSDEDETVNHQERRLRQAREREELEVEALEFAHRDAQFTMEQTLQLFSALSDKAFRLIRLNALVVTILVALVSNVMVSRYVNVPIVAAILLFVGSASFALFAYLTTTFNRGLDATVFEKLFRYKLREKEYLNWILTRAYPEWIAEGIEKRNRKEAWIRRSLIAFIAGMAMLFAGIILTLY